MRLLPLVLALAVPLAGCQNETTPRPRTAADSLAVRIADAAGGFGTFAALDVLRFDWAVESDGEERARRHHLWDRTGDLARIEWRVGADSVVVVRLAPAAFRADAPAGQAALNGQPLVGDALAERLVEAHRAHINDTYWLLAPLKTMDPGVRREVAARPDGPALALSFDAVGLTPGDRYWLHTDPVSGAMTGWSFRLEGDTTLGRWTWTAPQPIPTPRGDLLLPTVKENDAGRRILTLPLPVPGDDALWTDLSPRLVPGAGAASAGTR